MSVKGHNVKKSKVWFECDYCGDTFKSKQQLSTHMRIHNTGTKFESATNNNDLFCKLCNIEFKNKGLLVMHNLAKHKKDKRTINNPNKNVHCDGCNMSFFYPNQLRYHVRKHHFNLVTKAPYCEFKNINQVWFEKVLNTNFIVEIKKMDNNFLLIRKLDENTTIQPTDMPQNVIDLREMYPIQSSGNRIRCKICHLLFRKNELADHIMDKHISLFQPKSDLDLCV